MMDHDYIGLSNDDWHELKRHSELYPSHGLGCHCMDMYIRKMRNWLQREYGDKYSNPRFEYVLFKVMMDRFRP